MKLKRSALRLQAAVLALLCIGPGAADAGEVINLPAIERGARYAGFLVKFADGSRERADVQVLRATLAGAMAGLKAAGRLRAGAPDLQHRRRMSLGVDVLEPSRPLAIAEARAVMQALAALPQVRYVEPDIIVTSALVPNDDFYANQWGYHDKSAGIRADLIWDLASGAGITVAVLDTGITAHSDLAANIVAGYDFISSTSISNDGDGRDPDASDPGTWSEPGDPCPPSNSSWHGTHVAGTVAAVTNNDQGVAGTAFSAKVMPVRVMGTCGGSFGDLADAIVWSAGGTVDDLPVLTEPQIAKVINLSLGSSASCGATLQEAIDDAVDRGTTIVAAAGNRNKDVSTGAPANCANVIAVAAVDASGTKAIFSNYGEGIAVSAPGVYIVSTLNTGTKEPGEETYAIYEGTSMAAPHVAGVVALVQGRRLALKQPLYSPAKLRSVLTKTAYKLPGKCPGGCGAGIVDAYAAVQSVGHEVGDLISPAIRLLLD